MLHVVAEGIRLLQYIAKRFRTEERKDRARTVFYILIICKANQLICRFVNKAYRIVVLNPFECAEVDKLSFFISCMIQPDC